MGLLAYDQYEPNSTPKLTLSKLPCKPREPVHMLLTPPLHPSVSIPFHWEEAPGKPRAATDEAAPPSGGGPPPKAARCLDLPPRLLINNDEAKMSIMPSPTTVLDGPYTGRTLSLACTFSFRKGPVTGREDGLGSKRRGSSKWLGSGRWGSFRDEGKFDRKGSSDFPSTLDDFFRSEKNVKITRVRRKRSFFNLSTINSNLWAGIYASFKQAVPWKRA